MYLPHHLHGKVTFPMQPKPTLKPTPAWEIRIYVFLSVKYTALEVFWSMLLFNQDITYLEKIFENV